MGCPPRMTTPIWPHVTGSTGLHVTSSKYDPDLTTNTNYIMDRTETIKLATMLSTLLTLESKQIFRLSNITRNGNLLKKGGGKAPLSQK